MGLRTATISGFQVGAVGSLSVSDFSASARVSLSDVLLLGYVDGPPPVALLAGGVLIFGGAAHFATLQVKWRSLRMPGWSTLFSDFGAGRVIAYVWVLTAAI